MIDVIGEGLNTSVLSVEIDLRSEWEGICGQWGGHGALW